MQKIWVQVSIRALINHGHTEVRFELAGESFVRNGGEKLDLPFALQRRIFQERSLQLRVVGKNSALRKSRLCRPE